MTQINRTQKLTAADPTTKLAELNAELKATGYEVVIRKIPTKDVVAFDFGLVFSANSNQVNIFVEDTLQGLLKTLAADHGQVFIKVNWFSPDVMVITPAENPDPLQNTEDTDTAASLIAPVTLPEPLREPIEPLRLL